MKKKEDKLNLFLRQCEECNTTMKNNTLSQRLSIDGDSMFT